MRSKAQMHKSRSDGRICVIVKTLADRNSIMECADDNGGSRSILNFVILSSQSLIEHQVVHHSSPDSITIS